MKMPYRQCFKLKPHPNTELFFVNNAENLFDNLADSVDLINEVFSKQVLEYQH